MKTKIWTILGSLLVVLLLTACGEDGGSTPRPTLELPTAVTSNLTTDTPLANGGDLATLPADAHGNAIPHANGNAGKRRFAGQYRDRTTGAGA